jgi:hypothetical protein
MKKQICYILMLSCIVLTLAGCSNPVNTPQNQNAIMTKPLSDEQKDIVSLLQSGNQELLIFSYNTTETFKKIDLWLEIYKDGELIEPRSGGVSTVNGDVKPLNGEIAVIINQNPKFQWTFIIREDGTMISSTTEPSSYDYDNIGARSYGPTISPQIIEDGKEIILYTSVFSDSGIIDVGVGEKPDLMKQYPYVHLIKCKFAN